MLDLTNIKKIHFTGIKGVGMTALACLAQDFGCEITGSDVKDSFVTDSILEKKGIIWTPDFTSQKIETIKPNLLIYTVAHSGEENVEVVKAQNLNIPTLSQAQALGVFTNTKKTTISIAGVGGKTTTSAWLATCLENLNQNPSYMIGVGSIPSLDYPGKYDKKGDIFVTEADEYKSSMSDTHPKFYYQNPKIIIIPNLSYDHPDVYQSDLDTLQVFKSFIDKLPKDGSLIINEDSKLSRRLLSVIKTEAQILTYGEKFGQYKITNYHDQSFEFLNRAFSISIPGRFNALNAVSVILVLRQLDINLDLISNSISKYLGIQRRFQKIFEKKSTIIYDDYAHHPDEIKATLQSFKETFPSQKLITIFQPHTFSRTKSIFSAFSQSFKSTDKLILIPIFASAREVDNKSISSKILSDAVNKYSNNSIYLSSNQEVINYLKSQDLDNTIIITMGAGDVYKLGDEIKQILT